MPQHKNKGRRYSTEEKAAAVRMVRTLRVELSTSQGTTSRVAEQLGYGVESVRAWVRQADIDDSVKAGVTTDEQARMKALEQENRELKRANEILKRAAVDSTRQRNTIENDLGGVVWQRLVDQGYRRTGGSRCGSYGRRGHRSARSVGQWDHRQGRSSRSCYRSAGSIRRPSAAGQGR